MEEINQIETQSRAKTVNSSMCLKEKTSKPSIKPINGDVPSVICSEVKAAEDEHLGKDEIIAANDSKHLPSDKESETEVDLIKTPTSKRDVEVNQKAVRISEEKSSFDKVCGTAGHTEMTTDVTPDERQDAYGFSGQSSVQKIHSPVMHYTGINSIHMEKFHHIDTQTKYSNEDPSMRSEEESSKPD